MYGWMQQNRKKMMAIFGVVLMIAFILPSTLTHSLGMRDPVRGYAGDEEVTHNQLAIAAEQWEMLTELARQQLMTFGNVEPAFMFMFQAPEIVEAYKEHPEAFLLLQREAQKMNVGYSSDALNTLQTILPGTARDLQHAEFRRSALANLLLVNNAFERAVSTFKFSQPRVKQEVAQNFQTVRVNLVEFHATDFIQDVPAPTPEEIQKQIDTFGDVDPANIDPATNPHGFSYRLPNRIKLQYIQVPIDEVRRKVEASKSEFEWRSQAMRYYNQNQSRFPATQPAEESILGNTGDGLSIGGNRPAATQPTTRPFSEVYGEIRDTLMQPEIDRQLKLISDRIASLMQKGFDRHQAKAKGQDAPQVASSVMADYGTHEFLQQVAQLIQRETGVLPVVTTLDETWRGPEAIDRLPGLGMASLPDPRMQMIRGITLGPSVSEVLFDRAEPFRTEEQRKDPQTLSVLEPSPIFRDGAGNAYIVRMTAAVAAHAPTGDERQEVAGRAEQDLRMLAAYQKALEAARQLREQAEGERLLQSAANAANRRVITTGPISMFSSRGGRQVSIQGYAVGPASEETFAEQVFALLREATPERRHPTTVVELPRDHRVVVAELHRVEATPGFTVDVNAIASEFARQQAAQTLAQEWFDVEQIRQRMNWRPKE